jgi:hypothetical protein
MVLTKQERKFAELSSKRYSSLLYRNSQSIGWFGVILFALGLWHVFPLPAWLNKLFFEIGFFIIVLSFLTFAMTVIGKLYVHIQELEQNVDVKKPKLDA